MIPKSKKFVILNQEIRPGKGAQLNLEVAHLHTHTPVQVPVFVEVEPLVDGRVRAGVEVVVPVAIQLLGEAGEGPRVVAGETHAREADL